MFVQRNLGGVGLVRGAWGFCTGVFKRMLVSGCFIWGCWRDSLERDSGAWG